MYTLKSGIVAVILCLIGTNVSIAQQNKSSIRGFVKDDNELKVEFANVILFNLLDSSFVMGCVSDTSGYFDLESISLGNYYFKVVSSGYHDYTSPPLSIHTQNSTLYEDVTLHINESIKEIVIRAQNSNIRQEAGITIIDVEAGILNSGLSAADVLQRSPGAAIDKDGIVSLKGKNGVLVLLDGKPLYMDEAQVGALLKSLPADQIKEIEIITSPSAKYDAAGNAGIINIKLKKGAYEGLNGSVNGSLGKGIYPKSRIGINATYKKKRLTLSGGYQYSFKKDLQRSSINRAYTSYQDSSFYTYTEYANPSNTQNLLLNGSYDVGSKGLITWDGTLLQQSFVSKGNSSSRLNAPNGNLSSYFLTNDKSTGTYYNINTSIGYKHSIDTIGTELFIETEYKKNARTSNQIFTTDYYDGLGNKSIPSTTYESSIPAEISQWGGKIDFTKTLFYHIKMESGLKYTSIETNSNVSNTFVQKNNFVYTENIKAAYILLNKEISKWKLSGGIRLEQTNNKGNQKSNDSTFKRNYTNLFPSATISYQASKKTSYTFLYSKRIKRPSYQDLNPFVYYSDPYNYYAGNPYLLPQYTHNGELTTSRFNGIFLATINYSYTTQPISDIWIIDPKSLTTAYTTSNMDHQQNLGLSFSVNKTVRNWWTMNNYLYVYNNSLTGNVGYGTTTVSKTAWMLNATQTFKLPKNISAEVSFNYESPNYYGTIFYREIWQLSAGVQKKFMQDNLSVKLAVTDVFWKYHYSGEGTFGNTKATDNYKWDNRVLTLSINYRFGKNTMNINNPEKNSIIEKNIQTK
ncbi:TonB-dependent receptor [uncultured Cytophaga sp.]|uniref:TonB-dependent receptor n=1 Tax=uncultured Cytophaga sp. TaxID=160238 RepID=UPI00260870EA|nr:TonB-dependent receptor [uncultured Cytophaga sp.]